MGLQRQQRRQSGKYIAELLCRACQHGLIAVVFCIEKEVRLPRERVSPS
jgi:hypothetical protein